MRRRIFTLGPLILAAVLLSLGGLGTQRASAISVDLVATIDGPQAMSTTCAPGSAGTGMGNMTYDTVTNMLSWNITFGGLNGGAAPNAAHFHGPAVAGVSAGIQVTIVDLTSPSVGSDTITEAQEDDLLAGLYYINYHTAGACSGGEIRGQVTVAVGGVTQLSDGSVAPLQQPGDASGINGALIAGLTALAIVMATAGVTGVLAARRRDQS